MRKYFFMLFVLLSASHLMAQTDSMKSDRNNDANLNDSNTMATVVLSSNSLAFQIYENIKESGDNIVFSPYSLTIGLGMVFTGADGSTQSQMARLLRFPLRVESLNNAFALLTKSITKDAKRSDQGLVVNVANGLWIQRGQPLLPQFAKSIVDDYRGIIKIVDFSSRAEDARVDINAWVNERTQGKINQLFNRGEIPNVTRMLLISTIYMRGKWLKPFNASLTQQTPFFPSSTRSITVPMMTVTSQFPYLRNKDFSLLELPYDSRKSEGLDVAMYVLLPHDIFGLKQLENQMNASNLKQWIDQLQISKVVASLPRFKVTSAFAFEDILSRMGMSAPFSDSADFSKIDGLQDLKLSKIVQKSYIKVDEKGTEAAASTGVISTVKSIDAEMSEIFVADHPFMFFVIDKTSGAILFMGKISLPTDN